MFHTVSIFPLATGGSWKEKILRAAGVPIPDEAAGKKSYSLKPPGTAKDGASSLGILPLVCINVMCLVFSGHKSHHHLENYNTLDSQP